MANTAGKVGAGNGGKTDMERGSRFVFTYTKSGRKTGKTGGPPEVVPNEVTPEVRTVNDPRLV